MTSHARRYSFDRILVDLNTQCDLLLPKGALPVTNRTEILPNIRRLMIWARTEQLPMVSSLESHRTGESLRGLPPYCIDRSPGQRKIPFTLMPRRILIMGDNTFDVPHDPFRKFQQVIFTKRTRDFLSNPKADRFFQSLSVNHLVVFGVVAEHCVKSAVLALLARQHRIAVVTDACGCWSAGDYELTMRQMDAKGAVLVTTEELISGAANERIRKSRPLMCVPDEDEAAVTVSANGNGNGNGAAHSGIAAHRGNGKRPNGAGNNSARPLSDDQLRPAASERLRPDLRTRRRPAGVPKPQPPTGLA